MSGLLAVRGGGLTLSWRAGRWEVRRGGAPVRSVRNHEVDEIHLFGAVILTPTARAAALARAVPLVFRTADGRYRGRLEGRRSPSAMIALDQARFLAVPADRLELAREVVRGWLESQRATLRALGHRGPREALRATRKRLDAVLARLDTADRAALLGLEGEAAAGWFGCFAALVRNPAFAWTGRTRRPPKDPLNACLSFLYTLLAGRVEDAVRSAGLLPGAGALHEPGPGRAALVFDLVEEFRAPLVDRLVLRLVNRRQLAPEDFEDPGARMPSLAADAAPGRSGAVYLGPVGRQVVLAAWGALLRGRVVDAEDRSRVQVSWLLERQVRRMARVFQGRDPEYRSYRPG